MRARRLFCSLPFVLVACGGGPEPAVPRPAAAPASTSPPTTAPTPSASASACTKPAPVIAASGASVTRPKGSALRFQLVYQGPSIGVSELRGVDMIVGGSDGPFDAGKNSGWWAELRSASGAKIFTRLLRDPTTIEGPGARGGFVNATVDRCEPKILLVDVPNDPAASELVVFGEIPTRELARFGLR